MQTLNQDQQRLVERLTPLARKCAARCKGHQDPEEAEGVALMALCHAVMVYVDDKQVKIAVENAVNDWRRRCVYEQERGLAGGAAMTHQVTGSSSCGRRVDHTDVSDKIGCSRDMAKNVGFQDSDPETSLYWHELMGRLPKDLQPLAYARWIEGRTLAEIAELTGQSISTAQRQLSRAQHYAKLYLDGGSNGRL